MIKGNQKKPTYRYKIGSICKAEYAGKIHRVKIVGYFTIISLNKEERVLVTSNSFSLGNNHAIVSTIEDFKKAGIKVYDHMNRIIEPEFVPGRTYIISRNCELDELPKIRIKLPKTIKNE